MVTYVYTSLHMFTHEYSCLAMFNLVYLCLPLFTHVGLPMSTDDFSWLPIFKLLYLCLPLFARVYPCLLVFPYVYSCLPVFIVFTYVYSCFPMFTLSYLCLHMYTHVYICDLILENQPYHGNYDSEQWAHKDEKSLIWRNTFYHINNFCNEIPFIWYQTRPLKPFLVKDIIRSTFWACLCTDDVSRNILRTLTERVRCHGK